MSPRRTQEHRTPSQIDVARAAGVSAQTVSRVVSGQDTVRPETARRVLAAVESLGYRVHAAAASLASGRTRVLGLIVVATDRYPSAALSVGIERAAAAHGYTLTTASVADYASQDAIVEAFDRLERQGAEGIVLGVPVDLDSPAMRLRTDRTPTVRADRLSLNTEAPLAIDQSAIARLAVEHLLDLGHQTVWHVSGEDSWEQSAQRKATWEQVLSERGIEAPPVIVGDWTPESGYRAGRTIAAIPAATAVFVASDEMAFGVLRALHEAGRAVPGDVSVVSVDDIALAPYASPALTTVRQPFETIGHTAAMHLINDIEDIEQSDGPAIAPTLIVRDSTAPPSA